MRTLFIKKSVRSGFTVVEALVSLSLIALAMHGFISSTISVIQVFTTAENRHISSKIAQEGLELVVNKSLNHQACVDTADCTAINDWREGLTIFDEDTEDQETAYFEVSATESDQLLPGGNFHRFRAAPDAGQPERWLHDDQEERYICNLTNENENNKGKFGYCQTADERDGHYEGEIIGGNFKRVVAVKPITVSADDEDDYVAPVGIKVQSRVQWEERDEKQELILETSIYE